MFFKKSWTLLRKILKEKKSHFSTKKKFKFLNKRKD